MAAHTTNVSCTIWLADWILFPGCIISDWIISDYLGCTEMLEIQTIVIERYIC